MVFFFTPNFVIIIIIILCYKFIGEPYQKCVWHALAPFVDVLFSYFHRSWIFYFYTSSFFLLLFKWCFFFLFFLFFAASGINLQLLCLIFSFFLKKCYLHPMCTYMSKNILQWKSCSWWRHGIQPGVKVGSLVLTRVFQQQVWVF